MKNVSENPLNREIWTPSFENAATFRLTPSYHKIRATQTHGALARHPVLKGLK